MTENEGRPDPGTVRPPEPIRDDREGRGPAAEGDEPPADPSDSDDPPAIDLDAVRDRAS